MDDASPSAPADGDNRPLSPRQEPRSGYALALIAEIRLLVRAISNDPTRRISSLRLSYHRSQDQAAENLDYDQVLNEVSAIERAPLERSQLAAIAFLQVVRDALVALTSPATGLTIAYTTLVVGDQRSADIESAFDLATQAYGRLQRRALWHRILVWVLIVVAVCFTFLAAWEATTAALGKSLLQNMDVLRTQQVLITAEKLKLETSLDRPAADKDLLEASTFKMLSSSWIPLCDRNRNRVLLAERNGLKEYLPRDAGLKPLPLAASPAERDVCGRDSIVAQNIAIVHDEMQALLRSWPDMITPIGRLVLPPRGAGSVCPAAQDEDQTKPRPKSASCDVEYIIAPILQVSTNYTMPVLFGFLGSLLYVLVDHFNKLRGNTLNPKDLSLVSLRLILGLVVAACVSLLVSSYAAPGPPAAGSAGGAPTPGSFVASLTLSASGLAFLAGFGAEAVFTLLQDLIGRVFAIQRT